MSRDEADSGEKEFDPSQRRLAQAREEGDVIRSEDIQTAVGLAALLLAVAALGGWALQIAGTAGMALLSGAGRLSARPEGGAGPELAGALARMAGPWLVLLLLPGIAVILWLVASRGFVLAPSKLAFKGARLSPLANARQKFGRGGLVDFAKRALKMLAYGAALAWYLHRQAGTLFLAAGMQPGQIATLMLRQMAGLLLLFLALTTGFGLVDYLWQRAEFLRRHRMSRKEMTDEMKESDGDPHLKADRRRRGAEIALSRMLVEVPKADVVIVNPTHYAVALKWDRGRGRAPVCVAKGVDEVAARIRALAQESGVPVRRDPPTARALHASLEIGQEIRPEHYAVVAAAIRFADGLRRRARKSVLR
ncbi:EscU/YscU/HrcU family type III secretion system export apparatus switch protein [Xinfangfangia pollutisoli]|uniref:EscU/YscU/HrcU family type III secretion system export apparatus switch protein n=1 Tax=Xinfangfangia pollutisoli TaxID=2865960 RepID=UPI001CD394C8|nr:flagellar type III secretion system protein FlhB [Xinfangfangia pollutisoli]